MAKYKFTSLTQVIFYSLSQSNNFPLPQLIFSWLRQWQLNALGQLNFG